jgi:acetyl esterase/lipase
VTVRRFGRPPGERPLLDFLRQRLAGRGGDDPQLPPGATLEADLAFGADPDQTLDVYRPAAAGGAGIVVMVHGGGWHRGDKAGRGVVGHKVAHWVGQGLLLVSVNYRAMPAANPVQQAEDVALALAFVQANAGRWGGDRSRCVLVGHSAGAHLVALLAADTSLALDQGAQPWAASVLIDSAALDIEAIMKRPHFGLYDRAFGSDPGFWRQASPLARLTHRPAAPMLLVCCAGRDDAGTAAAAFADRVLALGGRATVLPVELNHAQINAQLGEPGDYTDTVDAFLASAGVF